jgi:hypothetical protein
LADWDSYRETAAGYLRGPDSWTSDDHPFFSEPPAESELARVVGELYGIETLFRVGLPEHPCRRATCVVFCATSENDLITPIVSTAMNKFSVEIFLSRCMQPFYLGGKGRVLCAVCIGSVTGRNAPLLPMFLDHTEYIRHFKKLHWNFVPAMAIHSVTALNQRYYQSFVLYVLCSVNAKITLHPTESPLSADWATFPHLTYTKSLQSILVSEASNERLPSIPLPGSCISEEPLERPDAGLAQGATVNPLEAAMSVVGLPVASASPPTTLIARARIAKK